MTATHYSYIAKVMEEGEYINTEYRAMHEYRNAKIVALDIETMGQEHPTEALSHKKGQIAVISMYAEGKRPVILHYPKGFDEPSDLLMRFLEKKTLVGHNIVAFDIPFLGKYGYRPFYAQPVIDTLIAEQMAIVSGRRDLDKDLESTIKRRLKISIDKNIDHKGWGNQKLNATQIYYVLNDVTLLLKVWDAQWRVIQQLQLENAWELEQSIFPIISNMIIQGMPLDLTVLEDYAVRNKQEFGKLLDNLMKEIDTDAVNSHVKVREAFAATFGVNLPNTRADTLRKLAGRADDIGRAASNVQHAREFRKRSMYGSTWLDKYYYHGRVNARYSPLGTDTARFSSSNPNMQNIPRNMRGMFGYEDGTERCLLKSDFSQIEVLIFAIVTGEKKLIEWYRTGKDVHSEVAAQLYNTTVEKIEQDKKEGGHLRRTAKAATFAMLFAGGIRSIIATARKEGVELSQEEAKFVLKSFFRNFPQAAKYIDEIRLKADYYQDRGLSYTLRLPNGPIRSMYGVDVTASRLVNTLVQGTAAIGIKASMRECLKAGIAQYIVATVHDEIVLDVPSEEAGKISAILEDCMKRGMKSIIGIEPKVETAYDSYWPN